MKRSDALSPLSREHHAALEVALRLRRASANDAAKVQAGFLTFFDDEGREHFRIEEELLIPAFARYAGDEDPDVLRVLDEHREIGRRAQALAQAAGDVEGLRALGELLGDHVRHEERTLFPRVEAALAPDELAALGTALAAAGGGHRPPRA